MTKIIFLDKISRLFTRLSQKKYLHFAEGVLITTAACIVGLMFGFPQWLGIFISLVIITALEVIKEYAHKTSPDPDNLIAIFVGLLTVLVVEMVILYPNLIQ